MSLNGVQETIFKRWINSHSTLKVDNLYDDLADGVHLVCLVESLTSHEFKSKIKNPNFRTQKMENITLVLRHLRENERIKFLDIDSSNILNKEVKIVLNFMWHIIEHFSILKPLEVFFASQDSMFQGKSLKQKFMNWLKSKVPTTIKNLTHDCRDGSIIGALINSYSPHLCKDWNTLQSKDVLNRARIYIQIAEKDLGISSLISADDLVSGKIDENCMMTYLSQFILCQSINGVHKHLLHMESKPRKIEEVQINFDSLLNIMGRGIQELGVRSGDNVEIIIEVLKNPYFLANHVTLEVKSYEGKHLDIDYTYDFETILCSYTPIVIGPYVINILIPILRFQKTIHIHVSEEYLSPIVAFGAGLEYACPGDVAIFMVHTNGETGTLNFTIEGPNEAQIECKDNGDGSATVEYWPVVPGEYAIHILYKGEDIKNSPFMVNVHYRDSNLDPSRIKAYGSTLCEGRVLVGETSYFTVDVTAENQRLDPIKVNCYNRFGEASLINIISDEEYKRNYSLLPVTSETLILWISYDNICIYGSPFKIIIAEEKLSNQINVYGAGIKVAYNGMETIFFVDCSLVKVEKPLRVIITDNSLKPMPCYIERNLKDSKVYSVRYVPSLIVARCFIDILYDDIPVFNKPFIVSIVHSNNTDLTRSQDDFTNVKPIVYNEKLEQFNYYDVLPDYSDIFLDPNAESYLKLISPPNSSYNNHSISDLPLPPPDLTDDSGDTSFDNVPSKFALSTVIEESEENNSVKDSIFSSECHSRASPRDDIISLSRKSSFTLPHSPSSNYSKQDINTNFDDVIPDEWSSTHNYNYTKPTKTSDPLIIPKNSLPPRPYKMSSNSLTFDDEFNDIFPLPEPPLDFDLISYNEIPSIKLKVSKVHKLKKEIEEIIKNKSYNNHCPSISYEHFDSSNSLLKTMVYTYLLRIPSCIINIKCLNKYRIEAGNVSFNNDNKSKEIITLNNDKMDCEMFPVIHMEPILSPHECSSCYLSDNSDSSVVSDHELINIPEEHKVIINSLNDSSMGIDSISPIVTEKIFTVDHYWSFLKHKKEITTSEISEISETSQWISNEDKIQNQPFEIEDHSFVNSFSDIPKSGFRTSESKKDYLNNCYNDRIIILNSATNVRNGEDFWKNNDDQKFVNNVIKGDNKKNVDKINLSKLSFKHVSWEYDETFPDPPTYITNDVDRSMAFTNRVNLSSIEDINENMSKYMTVTDSIYKDNNFKENKNVSEENNYKRQGSVFSVTKRTSQTPNNNTIGSEKECGNVSTNLTDIASFNSPITLINNGHHGALGDMIFVSQNNLETNKLPFKKKKLSLKSRKSCVSGSGYFNDFFTKYQSKQKNLSLESIFCDVKKSSTSNQKSLHGKRRSVSQTPANTYPFQFGQIFTDYGHVPGSLMSDVDKDNLNKLYPKKTHVRARSESDEKNINVEFLQDENAPIKLEKKNFKTIISDGMIKKEMNLVLSPSKRDIMQRKEHNSNKTSSKMYNVNQKISSKFTTDQWNRSSNIEQREINSVFASGKGLSQATSGKVAEFIIFTNGNGIEGISFAIEGPSETEIEAKSLPNGNCKVMYNPNTPGEYMLIIQQNNQHILGSPFEINVSAQESSQISLTTMLPNEKVYAEGQGLSEAFVNHPNQFTINTRDSGPGGLSLSIEGPSKAFIEFQDSKNGSCGVVYKVMEPGLYTCIVKFNKSHIKNSPFSINIQKPSPGITVLKESLIEKVKPTFQIGKKALFKTECGNIDMTGMSNLVAILICPNNTRKKLAVKLDRERNIFLVEFIPWIKGCHKLKFVDESNETENQNDINAFTLMVEELKIIETASLERELGSIKVYGKGLVKGRAGYSNIFIIEIGESVSGALNVTVDGPSKVEIKCTETDKGFRFSYIPCTPGDYLVTIKYGGEQQIKGSPFQVKITGFTKNLKQTCSKKIDTSPISHSNPNVTETSHYIESTAVTCYGSGLYKAKLHTWMNFYVDASKTKIMNHLFVAILGPNEPCEEIRITYMDRKRFLISYKTKEKGNHNIVIKWGDNLIHTNPWIVRVID